jgi:hypothetical protein
VAKTVQCAELWLVFKLFAQFWFWLQLRRRDRALANGCVADERRRDVSDVRDDVRRASGKRADGERRPHLTRTWKLPTAGRVKVARAWSDKTRC